MKKYISFMLATLMLMLFLFTSCDIESVFSSKVSIPDLVNVDEASAKTSLANKDLLPVVEYEYSNSIPKGNVVRTSPSIGTEVEKDTKITIYVSLGPKDIYAKDGTFEWQHIDPQNPDQWEATEAMISEECLYASFETTFGTSFVFKRSGFGNASLSDTFDKYVPLTILDVNKNALPENKEVVAGEPFKFVIKVPLSQLDSEKPTHIVCKLRCLVDGEETDIYVSLNLSW